MKKWFLSVVFTAVVVPLAQAQKQTQTQSIKVMSFNLENLFDTKPTGGPDGDEFTPNGPQHWTEGVLHDKMKNIGEIIREAGPDIIGLQEVENQGVLDELVRVGLDGQGYVSDVAANTSDGRGIRTALITRFPVASMNSHHVSRSTWIEKGHTKGGRDILEVTLDTGIAGEGRYVTVLVNHWLSKAGGPIRDGWREDEAHSMAEIIKGIVEKNPTRLVVALGDFNDVLGSRPITRGLPLADTWEAFNSADASTLFALDSELSDLPPEQSGTHYFWPAHEWSALDHIFTAEGDALKHGQVSGFHYVDHSVSIVHSRFANHDGIPQGCQLLRWQTNKPNPRTSCPNGASDHLPVMATFEVH